MSNINALSAAATPRPTSLRSEPTSSQAPVAVDSVETARPAAPLSCPFAGAHAALAKPAALGAPQESRSGLQQQADLYARVQATPYQKLPPLVWQYASPLAGMRLMGGIFFSKSFQDGLKETFATSEDVRADHTKPFHTFGVVGTARFEVENNSRYTGLFASGAPALVRLSVAADKSVYTPGTAVKFFIDNKPTVNLHTIPGLDALRSFDFFEKDFSNKLPEPQDFGGKGLKFALKRLVSNPLQLSIAHLAENSSDGTAAGNVVAPQQVFLRPVTHFTAEQQKQDFRDVLPTMFAPGDTLFEVFAKDADVPETKVGRLVLTQPLIASTFGDRELHFPHAQPVA